MMKCHLVMIIACVLGGCSSVQKKSDQGAGGADSPKLLKPEVKKIWIPPEIRNGGQEWVEGHYMYRIEREATWSR